MAKEKKMKIFFNKEMEDLPFPEPLSYNHLVIKPTELKDINPTEGAKLGGIADEATKNTGALADLDQVDTDQIFNSAITEIKLAASAVSKVKIQVDAIYGDVIKAGAITETKIGDNEISSGKIKASAIIAGKIATGAVTAIKILALAVTTEKIAAGAVTSDKVTTGELITLAAQIKNAIIGNAKISDLNATKINAGYLSVNRLEAGSITGTKIAANTIMASRISANMGELVITSDAGIIIKMPSSVSSPAQGGLIIRDSSSVNRLKINNNAFITSFNRAFAAASNTTGAFGNDWFQMYCEYDSVPTANAGILELPNTNKMLIKRSGGGAIIRIAGTSDQSGVIDLFEPLILVSRSSDPAGVLGKIFYHTTTKKLRVYGGDPPAWRDIAFA